MNTRTKYKECAKWMKELSILSSVGGLLAWDQETMLPPKGTMGRAEQSAILASVIHEKFIDSQMGKLLGNLARNSKGLTPLETVNVRERYRDYKKAITLPPDLVKELAHTTSLAQSAWIDARKKNNFRAFRPYLKKIFDLKKRQAEAYGYSDSPYDPLLDDYEPNMTTQILDPVIEQLKTGLIPLAKAIRESEISIDDKVLRRRYDVEKQKTICHDIMQALGVDGTASRLDQSAHPFCVGIFSPYDVRITTTYDERDLLHALYSVIHESGHALYEQGLNKKHIGTPMSESLSIGMHESQSRFWDNIIGRSKPFLYFLLPNLKAKYPGILKSMSSETFYRIINKVEPNLIRIKADEVHYNLHVILRYELEKDLIEEKIEVVDLPEMWKFKMEEYLGIQPKNDKEGVLQDTHWALGLIGYFPTYLLGNLYAAQLWYKIQRDIKNTDSLITKGEFGPILSWLRKKVHLQGRRYPVNELIKRVSGKDFSAQFFLDYLKIKYNEIYRIK